MAVSEFVNFFIVDATPRLFWGDRFGYHQWRSLIAEKMDVDAAALQVVGSSCLGFSINPDHMYRKFSKTSDIDVAVISAHHFDVAWRFLRRASLNSLKFPGPIASSIRRFAPTDVYRGCIATDRLLPILPFASEWMEARAIGRDHPTVGGRDVNFRLYRDLDGLREYQSYSVAKAFNYVDEDAS